MISSRRVWRGSICVPFATGWQRICHYATMLLCADRRKEDERGLRHDTNGTRSFHAHRNRDCSPCRNLPTISRNKHQHAKLDDFISREDRPDAKSFLGLGDDTVLIRIEMDLLVAEAPSSERPDRVDTELVEIRSESHVLSRLDPEADSVPAEVRGPTGRTPKFSAARKNLESGRRRRLTCIRSNNFGQ